MANEMREQLFELLTDCEIKYAQYLSEECDKAIKGDVTKQLFKRLEFYADHLIENGVVVPPCKVGDHIYYNFSKNASLPFGANRTRALLVRAIASTEDKKGWFVRTSFEGIIHDFKFSDFGKTVFLTKEQAEQKLKEMRGE